MSGVEQEWDFHILEAWEQTGMLTYYVLPIYIPLLYRTTWLNHQILNLALEGMACLPSS